MRRPSASRRSLLIAALLVAVIATAASAQTVSVHFYLNGNLTPVQRSVPTGMAPAEAALRALVAWPTQEESALGMTSMIPAGTSVKTLSISNTSAEIDMSSEVLTGLDDASLDSIYEQFRMALWNFQWINSIKLTCGGKVLRSYLPPLAQVGTPLAMKAPATSGVGLAGKKICIGPSHGDSWWGSYWDYQRLQFCGLGDNVREDLNSIRLVQFLKTYLENDGATFYSPRDLVQSGDGTDPDTGLPWWQMYATAWLRHTGLPCSVWAARSGDCNGDEHDTQPYPGNGTARVSDDIVARPLYANYMEADIYIAHHTNGAGGTGTSIYHDITMNGNSQYTGPSNTLATTCLDGVVNGIRAVYDSTWTRRGSSSANGDYGEIYYATRPAVLIEVGFHDRCDKDALYLVDDYFRSVAEWGLYSGICAFFGNTPTWAQNSCQYVSDTIPAAMEIGKSYPVSITYRNMGVGWLESDPTCPQFKPYRLGATGDSDPFAAFNRVNISGFVRPGDTYTFSFALTAPASDGTYTTEWQMVRDGAAWFGPKVTRQITVSGNDVTLVANPVGAGTLGGAGSYTTGTALNLTETPSPGYCFVNWSSDPGGTTILSRKPAYSYTVPSADTTIYANFVRAVFYDGLEGLTAGPLAMNDTGNPATNGDKNSGNAWWSAIPSNEYVGVASGLTAHSGTKSMWDGGGQGLVDYLNLGYRFNSPAGNGTTGSPYTGNVYLDWWFYDRCGTTHDVAGGDFCNDPVSLTYTSNASYMPSNADYSSTSAHIPDASYSQKLSLGMADVWAATAGLATGAGADYGHYQARIKAGSKTGGAATSYGSSGWFNTDLARSVGWHHGRIAVSPANGDSNAVSFYIDDMDSPRLTGTTNVANYNGLEFSSASGEMPDAAAYYGKGPMYDDISFGALPLVTAGTASGVTTSAIQWNWTVDGANGYSIWDAVTGGSSTVRSATNYPESGLTANTQYSRWVSAYKTQYAGDVSTAARVALAPTHTLAADPAYGISGNVTIRCDKGTSSGCLAAGSNVTFAFNNAFGSGPANVGKFGYLWDANPGNPSIWTGEAFWTSGATLVKAVGASGLRYLHIRSYNNDSTSKIASGGVLNLGPYVVATPVARISDLWPLANGVPYALSNKAVTGVVGNAFWIEETDRTAAIKVIYGGSVVINHSVDVTGTLDSSSWQRVLYASYVKDKGTTNAIQPLGVVAQVAGGQGINAYTPGPASGVGLYNVAILVSISGAADNSNTSDPESKYFYLDDGSGALNGAMFGIKVLCGSVTPPSSGHVIVTGLVGVASGEPVIIIRGSDDIRAL